MTKRKYVYYNPILDDLRVGPPGGWVYIHFGERIQCKRIGVL